MKALNGVFFVIQVYFYTFYKYLLKKQSFKMFKYSYSILTAPKKIWGIF